MQYNTIVTIIFLLLTLPLFIIAANISVGAIALVALANVLGYVERSLISR